ncbi:MAG: ribokinase [Planctomycetes bacterium]|nr:ribokinase [Planctomycetota bacterium]
MARLVVVGSLNMDLVVQSPRLPGPGETLLGGPFATFPGGKGLNQAVAAARLGATVTMVGALGKDDFGGALRAVLATARIDARLQDGGEHSGIAVITTAPDGENTIVVAPGANGRLDTAFVQAQEHGFAGAAAVLLQLEVPLAAVAAAAQLARRHGARVVLNAAPAVPLPDSLLAHVDVLVVNRGEAALMAHAPGADPETCAARLRARGCGLVVVTLGAQGAIAVDASGVHRQPGFVVVSVDTVGAGDAFVGALAVALAEGLPLVEQLRRGCAAGALATTRRGALPSLPTREEVDGFLRRQGG